MNLILAKVCSFLTHVPLDTVEDNLDEKNFGWVKDVANVIDSLTWPLIILVSSAGAIYAIVLGVQMARADSTEKREAAKKRVINVLLGVAIAVGLTLLLKLLMTYIPTWFGNSEQ